MYIAILCTYLPLLFDVVSTIVEALVIALHSIEGFETYRSMELDILWMDANFLQSNLKEICVNKE